MSKPVLKIVFVVLWCSAISLFNLKQAQGFSFTLNEDGTLRGEGYDFGTSYGNLSVAQQLHIKGGLINLTQAKTSTYVEVKHGEQNSFTFRNAFNGKRLMSVNTKAGVDSVDVHSGMFVTTEENNETVLSISAPASTNADILVVNKGPEYALKVTKSGVIQVSKTGLQEEAMIIFPTPTGTQVPDGVSMVQVVFSSNQTTVNSIRLPGVGVGKRIKFVNTEKKRFFLLTYNSNNQINDGLYSYVVNDVDLTATCIGISLSEWICNTQDVSGAGAMTRAGLMLKSNVEDGFSIINTKGSVNVDAGDGVFRLSSITSKMEVKAQQFQFNFDPGNESSADFYGGNSETMSFLQFDSKHKRVVLGAGSSINKTAIYTKSVDVSSQGTEIVLNDNNFFAFELVDGVRENRSFLRVDTANSELVLGEGSEISKTKIKSDVLDVSSQNTKIKIDANSSAAIDFVSGASTTSSFLRMGIDTISLGLGNGVQTTQIGTPILDMHNVKSMKVDAFKIIGSNSPSSSYIEIDDIDKSITLGKGDQISEIRIGAGVMSMESRPTSIHLKSNESRAFEIQQGTDPVTGSFAKFETGEQATLVLGEGSKVLKTRLETQLVFNGRDIISSKNINVESSSPSGVKVENVSIVDGKIFGAHLIAAKASSLQIEQLYGNSGDLLDIRGPNGTKKHLSINSDGEIRIGTLIDGVNVQGSGDTAALSVDVQKLTTGTGLKMTDNSDLTSGKLLELETSAMYAQNPMSLKASNMTGGKALRISTPKVTTGSALQVTSMLGNNLKGGMGPVPIRVWTDGTVTVSPDAKANLTHGEYVTLTGCTVNDNLRELVVTMVGDIARKSTCTEVVSLPSYQIYKFTGNRSIAVQHHAQKTYAVNENVTISGCETLINQGQYEVQEFKEIFRVSKCMSIPILPEPTSDLINGTIVLLPLSKHTLFSNGDVVNLNSCKNTWNNLNHVVIRKSGLIYKKFTCAAPALVVQKPSLPVIATVKNTSLHVAPVVKSIFAQGDKVLLEDCENSTHDGVYKVAGVDDRLFQVLQCRNLSICRNGICDEAMDCLEGANVRFGNLSADACVVTSDLGNRIEKYCDYPDICSKNDCETGTWVREFVPMNRCVNNLTVFCEPYGQVKLEDPYSSTGLLLHDDLTCHISNEGGVLVDISAKKQRGGKIFGIHADSLEDGDGLVLANKGATLSTGSLLKLQTGAISPTNGVARISGNNVKEGKILSIEANDLSTGRAVEISNAGSNLSSGSLLHVSTGATNGGEEGIVRVDAN
eukprot:Stramenopile-MAST_4_protein_1556